MALVDNCFRFGVARWKGKSPEKASLWSLSGFSLIMFCTCSRHFSQSVSNSCLKIMNFSSVSLLPASSSSATKSKNSDFS